MNQTQSVVALANFETAVIGLAGGNLTTNTQALNDFLTALIGTDGNNQTSTALTAFVNYVSQKAGGANTTDITVYAKYIAQLVGTLGTNGTLTSASIQTVIQELADNSGCSTTCQTLSTNLQALQNWFNQAFNAYSLSNPLLNLGGLQLSSTTQNALVVYYGNNWNTNQQAIINTFLNSIADSPWFQVIQQFSDANDNFVQPNILKVSSTTLISSASPFFNTSNNPSKIPGYPGFNLTTSNKQSADWLVFNFLQTYSLNNPIYSSTTVCAGANTTSCQTTTSQTTPYYALPNYITVLLVSSEVVVSGAQGTLGVAMAGYHSGLTVSTFMMCVCMMKTHSNFF